MAVANGRTITAGAVARRLSWMERHWVVVIPLISMVVSEYKLRRRAALAPVSGKADLQTIVELAVYGGVAAWMLLRRGARPPRLRRPPTLIAAVFVYGLLLLGSSLYATYRSLAMARSVQFVILCGLCLSLYRRARVADLHRLVHAYVVLCSFSVILGFAHRFPSVFNNRLEARRFNFLYVHPVVVGTYLGLAVVITVAYLRSPELRCAARLRWRTEVYFALFAINVVGLVLTKTRGAIGGAAVGLVVVAFLNTSPRRKQAILLAGAVSFAAVAIIAAPSIVRYLQRGESTQQLATLNSRTALWSQAWKLFTHRPLTGYGVGASRGIFLTTNRLGGGHDALINVLTDVGLPGVVAWLSILVGILVALFSFRRGTLGYRDRLLLLGMLSFMVVNAVTYEGLGSTADSQAIWLLVFVGWIGALRRSPEKGSSLRDPGTVPGEDDAPATESVIHR